MEKEEQQAADVAVLREHLWEHRRVITEFMVLHECLTALAFEAAVRLVGWDRETFIVADIMDTRELLDA
jgi:hypothetical protein